MCVRLNVLLDQKLIKPRRTRFLAIKMSYPREIITQALLNLDNEVKELTKEIDRLQLENQSLRIANILLKLQNYFLQLDNNSFQQEVVQTDTTPQNVLLEQSIDNFQKKNPQKQFSTMHISVIVLFAFFFVYFNSPLQVSAKPLDLVHSSHIETQVLLFNHTCLVIQAIILIVIFLQPIKTFIFRIARNIAMWLKTISIIIILVSVSTFVLPELFDILEPFIFSYLWPHLELEVFFPDQYLICK